MCMCNVVVGIKRPVLDALKLHNPTIIEIAGAIGKLK